MKKITDDTFCKENCVGYRETGGRCFCDGECEAKRVHDATKSVLLENIKEDDVLYIEGFSVSPILLIGVKFDGSILHARYLYRIAYKKLFPFVLKPLGTLSDLKIRYATEEEKKELMHAIDLFKTGKSVLSEIRRMLAYYRCRPEDDIEIIKKIKELIDKYESKKKESLKS